MTGFLQIAQHAFRVVRPAVSFFVIKIGQIEADDAGFREVFRVKTDLLQIIFCRDSVCPQCDGARKDIPAVVIRVLADQIDPSRCEKCCVILFAE